MAAGSRAPLVLLVDDETDQVEMYQLGLEAAGFDIITAYNGRDALTRASQHQPDAIVLDLRLPDMTGWEVCGTLKSDPDTEHIPVIILTAALSSTLAEEAAAAGCAAHLIKPCFPDHLAHTLREVLSPQSQA